MSGSTLNGNYGSRRDHIVTLDPYTGNDISSSGDATQYGRLNLIVNTFTRCSTDFFPIYNGDFWNVNLSEEDVKVLYYRGFSKQIIKTKNHFMELQSSIF